MANDKMVNITLSEGAANKIKDIIKEQGLPEATPVKVGVIGGGCAGFEYTMRLMEEGEGVGSLDTHTVSRGIKIIVDQMSLMYLQGTEITYMESLQATGFKFNNPMAASCGCGKSFTPKG